MEPSQTPSTLSPIRSNGAVPSATVAPQPSSILAAWQEHAQQQEEGDLRQLLSVIRRRAWVIAGVAAVVMAFTTTRALQEEEVFRGQFRVLVEPVNADDDLSDLTSVLAEQQISRSGLDYETQIQVLRSPELIEPVAAELQGAYPEITYFSLLESLGITRLGETKILQVSYTGLDPVQIQVVLDKLAETYLEYSLKERQTNLRQGINFVEKQLPDLEAQVDTLQDQLEAFRREYNFINPEMQANQVSAQIGGLSEQRSTLQSQIAEALQRFNNLQDESGAIAALEGAPIYQQLLGELRSVETQIATELTRFEPDSLAIRVLEEQRANILPLLQQEAQRVVGTQQAIAANQLEVLSVQNESLTAAEQQASQTQGALPALIRQYTDLQRELEVATETLGRFRLTRESLEIEAAQTEIPWQLIEVPVLPTAPISPDLRRSILLGVVASLLAGLGVALLLEKLDNVYHTVDELKAGTKLPLLGALPVNQSLKDSRTPEEGLLGTVSQGFSRGFSKLPFTGKAKSAYYGYGNSESSFLEALRVLHTNIRMLSSDRPIRSIMITSAQPSEGKSTISSQLAQVATAMGQRVLVVDVDLRKPQVHDRLNVPNDLGLSNLIADNLPLKAVLQQVRPDSQLFVLPSGKIPPDPTKLLSSQKMQQLMTTFNKSFDLVIYDAPPVTGLADVSLVGQKTDGLVLVTRMGKTDRRVLKQTIETLKLARIPTLGVVANGVKSTGLGGYRYYAYGYGSDASKQGDGSSDNFVSAASNGNSRGTDDTNSLF